MERKFTDDEIVKALECCCKDNYEGDCPNCPLQLNGDCNVILAEHALDLINRYQAENDRLRSQVNRLIQYDEERDIRLHARLTETARVDAIKEFAERLKVKVGSIPQYHFNLLQVEDDIDTLVKEMTGENGE